MNNFSLTLSKKSVLIISLSFLLAIVLSVIPWDQLRASDYYDRANYIYYIDVTLNKINWFDYSEFLTKIFYEWGWHYFLNFLTSQWGLNSTVILFSISCFVLTISFILVGKTKNLYICLFLINPVYIDFFYSQIRLSFAITFVYLSIIFFNKNRLFSLLFLVPSFFIHTSTFLFIFIFYTAVFLERNSSIGSNLKFLMAMFIGFIVAFVTGPYMSILLGTVEDRRAEYSDMSLPAVYVIYWIGLFLFLLLKYNFGKLKGLNYYYFYITVSILTMIFLNIFLMGYSSRFLAASFPFIALTLSEFIGKNEFFIILFYVFYTLVLWFFWLT